MNTLFRNFSHTFRRFFTASVLNLLGLSIAFAACFVILTQVDYDYNYNKAYPAHDRIYRVEVNAGGDYGWQIWLARPFCELVGAASPHIQAISVTSLSNYSSDFEVDEHIYSEPEFTGFGDYLEVFQPTMVSGTTASLNEPGQVLISASMARRFFGTTDAIGKTIYIDRKSRNQPLVVGGVYQDMPENSQLGNCVFSSFRSDLNKDSWTNWNYTLYIRLDSPASLADVERSVIESCKQNIPKDRISGEEDWEDFIHFTPLDEVHYSTIGNKAATSKAAVYLLLCVSVLILLTAAVNYMNFSLAETPMRLRSINTQKVLGASTFSLRMYLLLESVLVCVCGFLLSLLWLYLLKGTSLTTLVASDLSLMSHPGLVMALGGVAVCMGLLAGAYPSYYVTSFPPALVLKGSFGLSPKGKMLRTFLVCFQFFVSFMLIISVGIMYLQSRYIQRSDYGYDKEVVLVGEIPNEYLNRREAIVSELSGISGIEGISISQFVLSSSDNYMSWGRGSGERAINMVCFPVDYRYLSVMGIKITEGRDFKPGDGDVYIFNEAARKKYSWMRVDEPAVPEDYPVIGFCENIRFSSFRNNDAVEPIAFFIYGKDYADWDANSILNIRVASGVDKVDMLHRLTEAAEKIAPGRDFKFRFMDEVIDQNYHRELRFTRQILLFSLIAIVLSMIGVFGLTLFESEYRRKEIGIRKILGSSTAEILYMFTKRYFVMLVVCFVLAAPFGWWIGHDWLESFSDKTPIRAWVFVASFLLVSFITVLTVTFQCWKNANENPVRSIKTE
ncbi:FtsX-like permease family protein [Phocaeicola sp.]|uniref:ABC transporter permease n=1 Tax=Phocaeicola sp. TaxID=2773926 RepID=UPI0028409E6E|nr:FtsX-like permease family protein [Phocaeicola sp.]MDR3795475.1 ABC transporter permease [Phocaeicola sp.]